MDSAENKESAPSPDPPLEGTQPRGGEPMEPAPPAEAAAHVSHEPVNDATSAYTYHDDYGYDHQYDTQPLASGDQAGALVPAPAAPPPSPPSPSATGEPPDEEEEGMLRMSFLEHLEELRVRIIRSLMGVGIAFAAALFFTNDIWNIIQQPFRDAMIQNGVKDPKLYVLTPTEAFSIIWVKVPVLVAIFLASPWILFQVWSFIAPGLYKRERKLATPFILCTAGLFILGGLFAYFVAFKLGLAFLLGIAMGADVGNVINITNYFDLFVNVSLGMGLVFELPMLIFFLSLLRILTPQFLVRNSRYAILIIVVVAAIITPTPDVINLMLISVPMTLLYFAGVFASYLLWLSREGKRFPWALTLLLVLGALVLVGVVASIWAARNGYHFVWSWPFLAR
jgi:sec-independent protein translocase protein TatC